NLTALQIREILEYTTKPDASLKGKTLTGGNLDAPQALAAATGHGDRMAASAYYRLQGRLREAGKEVDAGIAVHPTADLWGERGTIARDGGDMAAARDASPPASNWALLTKLASPAARAPRSRSPTGLNVWPIAILSSSTIPISPSPTIARPWRSPRRA